MYRWGSPRGVRGHRLPLIRIGGRTYVERSAWDAFYDALNNGSTDTAEVAGQSSRSSKGRSGIGRGGILRYPVQPGQE